MTLELEDQNLGRPTNPEIQINPKEWESETIPQACENEGNWYYNFPGAKAEAKFLGKKIPTKSQWEKLGDSILGKLPLSGYRNYSTAGYGLQGTYGLYWSASPSGQYGYPVYLSATQVYPMNGHYRAAGFHVRCLKTSEKPKKKDGWIKISERLPEEKTYVWTFRISTCGNPLQDRMEFCSGKFRKDGNKYLNVSYWMPLPDLPPKD